MRLGVAVMKKNDVSLACAADALREPRRSEAEPVAAIERPEHRRKVEALCLFIKAVVPPSVGRADEPRGPSYDRTNSSLAPRQLVPNRVARTKREGCVIPPVVTNLVTFGVDPTHELS